MAADLYERALRMATSAAPADVAVAVVCQIEQLPPKPGTNGQGGPAPLWYLVTTMPDPTNLGGLHLRDIRLLGNGAPDYRNLAATVRAASAEIHELARTKLAATRQQPNG